MAQHSLGNLPVPEAAVVHDHHSAEAVQGAEGDAPGRQDHAAAKNLPQRYFKSTGSWTHLAPCYKTPNEVNFRCVCKGGEGRGCGEDRGEAAEGR